MTETRDIALSPLDARIRDETTRCIERNPSERLPIDPSRRLRVAPLIIDSTARDPTFVESDPAQYLILETTGEPRPLERPVATDDHLGEVTPQFTLRNTHRMDMYASETALDLEWRIVRDEEWRNDIARARQCTHQRPQWWSAFGTDHFAAYMANKRAVVIDNRWHETFGKPDPQSDEFSEP